ncbi:putative baseplate assembly protein [Streptomyces sp. NPDC057743]|uniref:putative baseplate assembly protein n=1 Tax=Streptomyces sp. NPDC057743 TaxID=3346236 RepID=UPI0036A6478F
MTGSPEGTRPGSQGARPAPVWNRPGLSELRYRVGTHTTFLDAMRARLPQAEGAALAGLTTREPDDPVFALLDAFAALADVLTFYQERIANEGFLRTATERASLVRLGRLVGHRPRPALAATTHLAYTLDAGTRTVVPAGSRVASQPAPGGLPRTYETSDDLVARAEWNRLPVRTTRPPSLTADTAAHTPSLDLAGAQHTLHPGDRLLFTYDDPRLNLTRIVAGIRPDPAHGRTTVLLKVPDAHQQLRNAAEALDEDVAQAAAGLPSEGPFEHLLQLLRDVRHRAEELRDPDTLATSLDGKLRALEEWRAGVPRHPEADALVARATVRIATLQSAARRLTEPPAEATPAPQEGAAARAALLKDRDGDGRTVLRALQPLLHAIDGPGAPAPARAGLAEALGAGSDALPRLLAGSGTDGATSLGRALGAVSVSAAPLPEVCCFRVKAAPLGAALPDDTRVRRLLHTAAQQAAEPTERLPADVLLLDAVYDEILPGSWIAVRQADDSRTRVLKVTDVAQLAVADEQHALRVTRLRLERPWTDDAEDIAARRATTVWAAGQPLAPAAAPDPTAVAGDTIQLDGIQEGLTPGRRLIVAGERTDVTVGASSTGDRGTGVPGAEVVVLTGVRHGFDGTPFDDRVRTTLLLSAPLRYRYRRETLVIHGNVVHVTAGETHEEVLGSGDAERAGQVFPLRRGPLTWVPSATTSGSQEALTIWVDGVAWRRSADLTDEGPTARAYQLRAGVDDSMAVEFGDGRGGARLPSGTDNVTAGYRVGGGRAGNVPAGRINQLVSRPFGVSAVTNPLPATGGADADDPDATRRAVPQRPAALDRLVSVRDHEDFARAFAGVDKAVARRCAVDFGPVLHVTVAVADPSPDATAALLTVLRTAFARNGDPTLTVRVELCERVRLVLALGVRIAPGHRPDDVEQRVRDALTARLGFAAAELAEPVFPSAALAAAQAVPGVDRVEVDAFGGFPETNAASEIVRFAEHPTVAAKVPARPARACAVRDASPPGPRPTPEAVRYVLRPAQLVLLDPAVPETLVLRRIP